MSDRTNQPHRMQRTATRAAFVLAVAAMSLGVGVGAAFAGSAYSATRHFSTPAHDYHNDAGIHTNHDDNHANHASTGLFESDMNALPGGWLAAQPIKRDQNGNAVCFGTWLYSDEGTYGIGAVGCFGNTHTAYSSQGNTKVWTIGQYSSSYYTYLSPNQNS